MSENTSMQEPMNQSKGISGESRAINNPHIHCIGKIRA